MAGKGIFAVVAPGPPPPKGGGKGSSMPSLDDEDDVGEDSKPVDDDSPDDASTDGGPFESYAETIFDPKADTAAKTDALRQAILTVLEERGGR